jgi:hydroxymethylpyrimidine pyrophosphatase-like HAD family hydrolase
VANALPAVKEIADLVTTGARGAGVTEVLDAMIAGELDAVPIKPKGRSA